MTIKGSPKKRRVAFEHIPRSASYTACYISEFMTCRYLASIQEETV